jgi:hypothetical protein
LRSSAGYQGTAVVEFTAEKLASEWPLETSLDAAAKKMTGWASDARPNRSIMSYLDARDGLLSD